MPDKQVEAARAEAEAAQAGLISALGDLGSAAESAKDEATATAKRFAPVAVAAAGALMAVSVIRRLR